MFFYHSNELELSKPLSFWFGTKPIATVKEGLHKSEVPNALILFGYCSWKTVVSKFTQFHEIYGDESDPGDPQLMILQGFVENKPGKGIYLLQDTHGLNGIHPAENKQSIIQIPEEALHAMFLTVWFVENLPQPINTDVQTQGQISSP